MEWGAGVQRHASGTVSKVIAADSSVEYFSRQISNEVTAARSKKP